MQTYIRTIYCNLQPPIGGFLNPRIYNPIVDSLGHQNNIIIIIIVIIYTCIMLQNAHITPVCGLQVSRRSCNKVTGRPTLARRKFEHLSRPLDGPVKSLNIDSASLVFEDDQGDKIPVMSADYGFRSGAGRLYQDGYGGVPRSILELSVSNFKKELMALRRSVRLDEYKEISSRVEEQSVVRKILYSAGSSVRESLASFDKWLEDENVVRKLNFPKNAMEERLTEEQVSMLKKDKNLRLDDKKVAQAEKDREARQGKVEAPMLIRLVYNSLCWALDLLYEGRPIQRFWVLETVARMPYFSYISMLHLYESLGWWRAGAEVRKVHFAEEWNELHHLQIMESLGGDQLWIDRFMAEHAAVFYYWILLLMYAISPSSSYAFSELVEVCCFLSDCC